MVNCRNSTLRTAVCTYICDRRHTKKRNTTFSLPDDLMPRAKSYAAEPGPPSRPSSKGISNKSPASPPAPERMTASPPFPVAGREGSPIDRPACGATPNCSSRSDSRPGTPVPVTARGASDDRRLPAASGRRAEAAGNDFALRPRHSRPRSDRRSVGGRRAAPAAASRHADRHRRRSVAEQTSVPEHYRKAREISELVVATRTSSRRRSHGRTAGGRRTRARGTLAGSGLGEPAIAEFVRIRQEPVPRRSTPCCSRSRMPTSAQCTCCGNPQRPPAEHGGPIEGARRSRPHQIRRRDRPNDDASGGSDQSSAQFAKTHNGADEPAEIGSP